MYLLDTNVVSELRKAASGKADGNVVAWAARMRPLDLFLSVVVVLELKLGVLRIERRDAVQGKLLRRWFEEQVLPAFAERVLAVDTAVALRCAELHATRPRAERDSLIAATALVHGMTVVTRNHRDFEGTGVALLNPWDAAGG